MNFSDIDAYFEYKEAYLDSFIDNGGEHELFVSSYIHGHFSVQAAKVCAISTASVSEAIRIFENALGDAINQAIENKELSAEDATDVKKMLGKLWQH